MLKEVMQEVAEKEEDKYILCEDKSQCMSLRVKAYAVRKTLPHEVGQKIVIGKYRAEDGKYYLRLYTRKEKWKVFTKEEVRASN